MDTDESVWSISVGAKAQYPITTHLPLLVPRHSDSRTMQVKSYAHNGAQPRAQCCIIK